MNTQKSYTKPKEAAEACHSPYQIATANQIYKNAVEKQTCQSDAWYATDYGSLGNENKDCGGTRTLYHTNEDINPGDVWCYKDK